ncbi:Arrestin domain-containing protein C31A2.12 [Choanephora cucurbitarum]|uniref:Arrestin domain-containing protein C31A2.12 n=1 Tax=Choanephora cucurbitarum TaxID=101091 RepID=A0A1C7N8S3_9FUNG|nr:Arrestin domain-containing protein C31A2.12 [Choanephora cucurbitarum]
MVSAIRHKATELSIELETKEIVLLGHASESAGKLLRGSLVLSLTEPMKVRSVHLTFTGKMKVSWSEGIGHHQHYHKQEKDIIEHNWEFLPAVDHKKAFTLGAGQHKWDFELMLPGDLPQSLEAEGGQVVYRLKAMVERTAFLHNLVKKQVVQIVRCMMPSEFDLVQTLEIHNTWAEKMMYDILLPSKVYARGQPVPITFHITPIANRLRVRTLTITLKEYCTYTANDCTKTDTRIVKMKREEDPFSALNSTEPANSIVWTKQLALDIPPMSSTAAFCDADNEMIRIRHKLKFIICLINADGHLSELRCSVPIIIISSIAEQTEFNTLPAYHQTWQSICLDPASAASSAPGTPTHELPHHSSPMAVASSGIDNHRPLDDIQDCTLPTASPSDSLWWHGTNLSRVPSYRTAAEQEPAPFSTSLPSYEQLSISPRHTNMFGQLSFTSTTNNNNTDNIRYKTPPTTTTF